MGGDPFVMDATFKEVQACRKAAIMINTFMLANDYYLVEFVKQMSAMTNGKAYFANPMTLGQFLLMDFLKGKTLSVDVINQAMRQTLTNAAPLKYNATKVDMARGLLASGLDKLSNA